MIDICFSIGSNMADRVANLKQAIRALEERIGAVKARSNFYECSSWGFESAPFINAVVVMQTEHSPRHCFEAAQRIESEMGRMRSAGGYADRIIDLDILSYGLRRIETIDLVIPHPRAHERRFVLQPWAETCPYFVVPTMGKQVAVLLEECTDTGRCEALRDV